MKFRFQFIFLFLVICAPLSPNFAQTPNTTDEATAPGYELHDVAHGIKIKLPNALWGINANKYAISLSHGTYFDVYISLKKSWYAVTNAGEAYSQRRISLRSYLPGAVFIKENEAITIGTTQGLSMTYTNPSEKKVVREIVFIHKGVPYEVSFTVKEENFNAVKADFGAILQNLQLI
jgi:hypothetical protein